MIKFVTSKDVKWREWCRLFRATLYTRKQARSLEIASPAVFEMLDSTRIGVTSLTFRSHM